VLATALLVSACDRAPSDLREWRVSDHDHTSNPNETQVEVKPDAGSPLAAQGLDEVTIVTWKENCAKCHGTVGAGDGPQGPMTGTRDLTDPEWQAATTDATIAQSIRNGRGRMPAFNLPDATVTSLVRLVRLFDARRQPKDGQRAP
jgi:cytochrome c oxidase cbb3-type subunit 3